MPTRTQAIKLFLTGKTHADLAALYNHDMEVQVNVAQDAGEVIEGEFKGRKWRGFTDGIETWKPFRIPWNAKSEATYEDSEQKYNLEAHAEAIGMTGWDWKSKVSKWVAFDFDSLINHKVGLTQLELDDITTNLKDIQWVTIRKSTSGTGLHIYIMLPDIKTENHGEHSALARALLGKLSAMTAFDFQAKVDCCGGNMWVWHRKMKNTPGLSLLKQGRTLTEEEIPANWKEHLKVLRQRKAPEDKVSTKDSFEQLANQRNHVSLDSEHKKLIAYLEEINAFWWWDQDLNMLVTHTHWLKKAHTDLALRGVFETNTQATNTREQNCFAGDTEIITKEGVFQIKDLVDKEPVLYVMTPYGMQWQKCQIKSFGIQKTIRLMFGNGDIIRCTENHQWLQLKNKKIDLLNRISTKELKIGKTQLPICMQTLPDIDYTGYAHGFVYGDGWLHFQRGKTHCEVSLFKHDNDLCHLLCQYGTLNSRYYEGHGNINTVCNLPNSWKSIPENVTKEYALGFVLGLVSADGFVNRTVQIFQSDYRALLEIRKLATYAGLRTGPVRGYTKANSLGSFENSKAGFALTIFTNNLSSDHFIRKDHKLKFQQRVKNTAMTVSAINYQAARQEEVFCAIVPNWHNFTLANNVITGNCFAFPTKQGGWTVRRYTPGIQEHNMWETDSGGWTKCIYNKEPDLRSAARSLGAVEDKKGAFKFQEAEMGIKALEMLGVITNIHPSMRNRPMSISIDKKDERRLKVEIEKVATDLPLQDWSAEAKTWFKAFTSKAPSVTKETDIADFDDYLRHLVTNTGDDYGWAIFSDKEWRFEPYSHIKVALKSIGEDETLMGAAIFRPWKKVNLPLQPEYPGKREWNLGSAQLAFAPSTKDDLSYPTWTRILQHCGNGLDDAIKHNAWARANGLKTGADYLKCWVASLFQFPMEPLPYLFFYGEQDCGKSTFHEALTMLLTRGVKRADAALVSQSNFNAELEDAILCVVEETDLQNNKQAYNRIKDWVTGRDMLIHKKGMTPYTMPNTTHWCQMANERNACPVFPGDTRITMCWVQNLGPVEKVPKNELFEALRKEAPDFLAEVLALEIPRSNDRLKVPAIITSDKLSASEENMTPLERFLHDQCYPIPGKLIKYSEFYDRFKEFMEPNEVVEWTQIKTGRNLPPQYPKGRLTKEASAWYIGNISFSPLDEGEPVLNRLILVGDKLVPLEERHD